MEQTGDYDKRGPDFETFLIGEIMAAHIDAGTALCGRQWANGFPELAIVPAVDCGDSVSPDPSGLRVAYAITYCEAGGAPGDAC